MHEFNLDLKWSGSSLGDYSRNAVASVAGKPPVDLSAAPSYAGDASCWNPEDLFGSSVAMCHLLTFLALAHKLKLDVLSYQDNVRVIVDMVDKVMRVTQVILSPEIQVGSTTDVARVEEIFRKAHKYCFIGNSITSEVVMNPRIVQAPAV